MGQSIRQIKNRIKSVENTEKVTSAMQMVASSKLNRMDTLLAAVRPYFFKVESLTNNLLTSVEKIESPFIAARQTSGKILLCLIASDSGLCGVYNNNILRVADEFLRSKDKSKIKLVLVGKKGFNYFKKHDDVEIYNSYIGLNGKYSESSTKEILKLIVDKYLSGAVDEVYVAYTHFQSALVHKPVVEKFLNLDPQKGKAYDYIFDPSRAKILDELIPRYVNLKFRLMLLEAFTAEHASRTVAMKMATENARDMLQSLTLLRNKVRQARITEEMLDIISSAEALKG